MACPFLFIDDSVVRRTVVQHSYPFVKFAETAEQAIALLAKNMYRVISLDYVLGQYLHEDQDSATGMKIIQYIINNPDNPNFTNGVIWIAHSHDEMAAKAMERQLRELQRNIRIFCVPFDIKFYVMLHNFDQNNELYYLYN